MSKQPARPDKTPDLCDGAFVFDVGTSPHGLSADLPLSHQETPEAASWDFHAMPVLIFDLEDEMPEEIDEAYYAHLLACDLLDGGRYE